jgi:hypothetical protein
MPQLTTDEAQWVTGVAEGTGIDPRVLIAWAQDEGAYAPNGTGGHNYLNLRPSSIGDVGVTSISSGDFDQFANVQDAIASTVARIKQPFASAIIENARGTPAQELAAIASTGWDGDAHYGGAGGPQLQRDFSSIFGNPDTPYEAPTPSYLAQLTGDINVGGSAATPGLFGSGTLEGAPGALYQGSGAQAAVNAAGGAISGVTGSIDSVGKFFSFVTSLRFAEIVGGVLLVAIGLLMIMRSLGMKTPGGAAGAVSLASKVS